MLLFQNGDQEIVRILLEAFMYRNKKSTLQDCTLLFCFYNTLVSNCPSFENFLHNTLHTISYRSDDFDQQSRVQFSIQKNIFHLLSSIVWFISSFGFCGKDSNFTFLLLIDVLPCLAYVDTIPPERVDMETPYIKFGWKDLVYTTERNHADLVYTLLDVDEH